MRTLCVHPTDATTLCCRSPHAPGPLHCHQHFVCACMLSPHTTRRTHSMCMWFMLMVHPLSPVAPTATNWPCTSPPPWPGLATQLQLQLQLPPPPALSLTPRCPSGCWRPAGSNTAGTQRLLPVDWAALPAGITGGVRSHNRPIHKPGSTQQGLCVLHTRLPHPATSPCVLHSPPKPTPPAQPPNSRPPPQYSSPVPHNERGPCTQPNIHTGLHTGRVPHRTHPQLHGRTSHKQAHVSTASRAWKCVGPETPAAGPVRQVTQPSAGVGRTKGWW